MVTVRPQNPMFHAGFSIRHSPGVLLREAHVGEVTDSVRRVPSRQHEQVVEAVLAHGPHPAFGERVRPWRADRREDGLGTDRDEGLVEAGGELGVQVSDDEAQAASDVFELRRKVAGDLGYPRPVRAGGHPQNVYDPLLTLITNST
jgi:hypothetical protein